MRLTIEYLKNPNGSITLFLTKRGAWFLETQIELFRKVTNHPGNSEVADGMELALFNDHLLRKHFPNSVGRAVWECREPTPIDREYVRQAVKVAPTRSPNPGYRTAYDLLRPKRVEGWDGVVPPNLLTALEYECCFMIMSGTDG